jgi:multidrug resistance efflux pump
MINVLLLGYIALLALFVWLGLIPFNRFWKFSPVIVALALLLGLFIPMGWGAPSGAAVVARNSVQVVPSVAGEVIEVPVVANKPLKEGDILFRIDPTTYQAQVRSRRNSNSPNCASGNTRSCNAPIPAAPSTCSSVNRKWTSSRRNSTARNGISTRPRCGRRPTATSPM